MVLLNENKLFREITAMTLEETKARMYSGKVYYPSGDDLMAEQAEALELQYDYNLLI